MRTDQGRQEHHQRDRSELSLCQDASTCGWRDRLCLRACSLLCPHCQVTACEKGLVQHCVPFGMCSEADWLLEGAILQGQSTLSNLRLHRKAGKGDFGGWGREHEDEKTHNENMCLSSIKYPPLSRNGGC